MTCHLNNKAVIKQNCIEAYKAVYNLSQHHQRRSALHAETRISYGSPLFVVSLLAPTRQDIKPVMPQLTSHFDQLHLPGWYPQNRKCITYRNADGKEPNYTATGKKTRTVRWSLDVRSWDVRDYRWTDIALTLESATNRPMKRNTAVVQGRV